MSSCLGSRTKAATLVLASKSPNRLRLMRQIGVEPIVRVSDFEENLSKDLSPEEYVIGTAVGKLRVIVEKMKKEKEYFDAIIACDTTIVFDREIIGKPLDAEDAVKTLKRMRGKEHEVFTGVAIAYADGSVETFAEKTNVKFANFSDKTIEQYVATEEPLNKAGSYGIQDLGAVLVEKVDGCFSNVVGLPIGRVFRALTAKGINIICPV